MVQTEKLNIIIYLVMHVINKTKTTCENSNYNVYEHFADTSKPIKGDHENVQNGDSRKKVIALGQTYFAIQTHKQELSELEYEKLSEDEKKILSKKYY